METFPSQAEGGLLAAATLAAEFSARAVRQEFSKKFVFGAILPRVGCSLWPAESRAPSGPCRRLITVHYTWYVGISMSRVKSV